MTQYDKLKMHLNSCSNVNIDLALFLHNNALNIKHLIEAVNRDRDEYCTINHCACDLCEAIKPFNDPVE